MEKHPRHDQHEVDLVVQRHRDRPQAGLEQDVGFGGFGPVRVRVVALLGLPERQEMLLRRFDPQVQPIGHHRHAVLLEAELEAGIDVGRRPAGARVHEQDFERHAHGRTSAITSGRQTNSAAGHRHDVMNPKSPS